jgi:hypothetical protein
MAQKSSPKWNGESEAHERDGVSFDHDLEEDTIIPFDRQKGKHGK